MAEAPRKRATKAELEQRLSEISELLVARATSRAVVRFAMERWGVGERAAEKYVEEARRRLAQGGDCDRRAALGLAIAGYELLWRKALTAGDLRGARAVLDKLVAVQGLAATRNELQTISAIASEISRLEAALADLEEREP